MTVVLLHVSLEVKDRQIKGKTCVCRIGKFTEGVARYGIASQKMCVCVCVCVSVCVCVCVCVGACRMGKSNKDRVCKSKEARVSRIDKRNI